ncbi:MAG TPA: ornithine cyclodeaminase family protein [Acidimicrobiales bacterium]|nr:ornithine cyclodeaminase family protein [Acidimicrobiales bacterium]
MAVPVLEYETVLAAVSPARAIDVVRDAFVRYHRGEWHMPPKLYLPSPPGGDFRAMPALGDGLAILKWVTSFPANQGSGVPTVSGLVCVSDAGDGELRMLVDGRAVTALRTGAAAAVAAQALASSDRTVGIIGCGVHGAWAARCLHAAGFGPGVCADPDARAASALAEELGWATGSRADATSQGVVTTATPGTAPVLTAGDLHPRLHLTLLGADGPGKAETTVDVLARCALFCDEWEQASHGGELRLAVEAARVTRADVTELGAVLSGERPGRTSDDEVTAFDSTGLAIQDLAIAHALWQSWSAGSIDAPVVRL